MIEMTTTIAVPKSCGRNGNEEDVSILVILLRRIFLSLLNIIILDLLKLTLSFHCSQKSLNPYRSQYTKKVG